MVQDWDIKPRGMECGECKAAFEDRQVCCSALIFGQEGYSRGDYCEKCWEEKARTASAFSAWTGFFKKPPPPTEEPLKKENVEELLRRLMANEDPAKRNVIYILAIILERKRVLVEKDVTTRDDGVMIRVFEHKKTGETFLVPDPKLGFEQLAQVQQEVSELLGVPKRPSDGDQSSDVSGQQSASLSDASSIAPSTSLRASSFAKATADKTADKTEDEAISGEEKEAGEEKAIVPDDETEKEEGEMNDDEDEDEFDDDDEADDEDDDDGDSDEEENED